MEPIRTLVRVHPTRSAVIGIIYEIASPREEIPCLFLDYGLGDSDLTEVGRNMLVLQKHGFRPVRGFMEEWILAAGVTYDLLAPPDPEKQTIRIFSGSKIIYAGRLIVARDWKESEKPYKACLLAAGNFRFLESDNPRQDAIRREVRKRAISELSSGKAIGASVKRFQV